MSAISIQTKVAEEIKGSGPKVEQYVIDALASQEISKRKDAIIAGLSKLKTMQGELKKLDKADVKTHVPEAGGYKAVEAYSDELLKQVNEAKQKLKKFEDTLNEALEKHDGESYSKLYDAVK